MIQGLMIFISACVMLGLCCWVYHLRQQLARVAEESHRIQHESSLLFTLCLLLIVPKEGLRSKVLTLTEGLDWQEIVDGLSPSLAVDMIVLGRQNGSVITTREGHDWFGRNFPTLYRLSQRS